MTTKPELTIEEQLTLAIPNSLDDIIRIHRDKVRFYQSTEDQVQSLTTTLVTSPVRETLSGWHFVTRDITNHGITVQLLGRTASGLPWTTSSITGIDLSDSVYGFVQTENSLYRLVMSEPGVGEPESELLALICAQLHQSGAGAIFGVPEWSY